MKKLIVSFLILLLTTTAVLYAQASATTTGRKETKGKNWTDNAVIIYENDCEIPEPTTTMISEVTTSTTVLSDTTASSTSDSTMPDVSLIPPLVIERPQSAPDPIPVNNIIYVG